MKAWGDMSTNQQIEADQMVQISCLTIDQYLYSCSLKTTTPRENMKMSFVYKTTIHQLITRII